MVYYRIDDNAAHAVSRDIVKVLHAISPFSQHIEDWGIPPNIRQQPTRDHYIPRGERATWTRSQYEVYKEEQLQWKERVRHDKEVKSLEAEKAASLLRHSFAKKPRHVQDGRFHRLVSAVVSGRRNGEAAIPKGSDRLPTVINPVAGPQPYESGRYVPNFGVILKNSLEQDTWADLSTSTSTCEDIFEKGEIRSQKFQDIVKYDAGCRQRSGSKLHDTERKPDSVRRVRQTTPKEEKVVVLSNDQAASSWVVPDTDSESEVGDDIDFEYDSSGEKVIHCWTSEWRVSVARCVNRKMIRRIVRPFKASKK